ncbi:MAG: MurR/RpiR family transcriptional regulator [Burkholderiaceae bacterium]|nr:MurR/RpiR family transcriptional regulator [Burkholderiaceae bacterium]
MLVQEFIEPGLLVNWGEHTLHTAVLQSDGQIARPKAWPVDSGVAALAGALVAAPSKIRHAALVVHAGAVPPAAALRQILGLDRVEPLGRAQALAVSAPKHAAPQGMLGFSGHPAFDVLCDIGSNTPMLATSEGRSPLALMALLRHPWPLNSCRVIGDALCSADANEVGEALAMLCGLLALAGHRSILIYGPLALREALADWGWGHRLARFRTAAPDIAWWDEESKPEVWLTGAALHLGRFLRAQSCGLCERVRASFDKLTRTERRVAEVVLANPTAAVETATARLAEAAAVSQPQVIRFCRAMGFDGVSSFKRALGASLAIRSEALFSTYRGDQSPDGTVRVAN